MLGYSLLIIVSHQFFEFWVFVKLFIFMQPALSFPIFDWSVCFPQCLVFFLFQFFLLINSICLQPFCSVQNVRCSYSVALSYFAFVVNSFLSLVSWYPIFSFGAMQVSWCSPLKRTLQKRNSSARPPSACWVTLPFSIAI